MRVIIRAACVGLVVFGGAVSAGPFSGIHPLQSDRFHIGFGGFYSEIDGHYNLDDPDGDEGTDVDLQDDLGLDDSELLPAMGLTWRLSNNTRIQGEYFNVGQDSRHTIDHQIEWGDLDFQVGASVKADMQMDIARAFYGYSFVKDDRKEFGAGLGLHYLNLDVSLAGNATVDGIPLINAEEALDDWAILPNIGAYGNYALSSKWLISGRIDWISANIEDYDGELWNVEGAVQYQAFKHFGVGLAYRYLDFELAAKKSSGDWDARLEYYGPLLFFTANF